MSALADVIRAVESYDKLVEDEVRRARGDPQYAADLQRQWNELITRVDSVTTPTGLKLPRVALPRLDEAGEIARFLHAQGAPGQFPYPLLYPSLLLRLQGGHILTV